MSWPVAKSKAALRYEKQRQDAVTALAARRLAKATPRTAVLNDAPAAETGIPVSEQAQPMEAPAAPPTPEPGAWRLADLGPNQCRHACTSDNAPAHAHRFCGQPTTVGRRNLHGSWCEHHLPLVWGPGTKSERAATNRPRGE